jgi:hypothetical protein
MLEDRKRNCSEKDIKTSYCKENNTAGETSR